jgi:hypothetical protein
MVGIECDLSIPVWKLTALGGGPLVLYQGRRVNRTCPWRMERLASGPDPSRPGGPPAKRQPSPEGLGRNPRHDPERHRRGTHLVLNQSAAWRNRGCRRSCRGSCAVSLPVLTPSKTLKRTKPCPLPFVQSLFSGCEGCNQPSLRSECHSRIPRQKPVTSSAAFSPPIGHGCRAYGARDHDGDANPALPGWADVWRAALRALMGLVPETTVPSSMDGLGF